MKIEYSWLFTFLGLCLLIWTLLIWITACTYSIQCTTNVNVGGESTDTIEDAQSQDIKPTTTLDLPKIPL